MYIDDLCFPQGDRMWMYAISIFLIALTPGSFLFTAIYGLAVSLAVVAFGTLVGDWIDVTSRLKGTGINFPNCQPYVFPNSVSFLFLCQIHDMAIYIMCMYITTYVHMIYDIPFHVTIYLSETI